MSLHDTAVAPIDKEYEITLIRFFTIMTVVWGIVGMTVGVFIASQLAWPALNFDIPWLTFSRLRPFCGVLPLGVARPPPGRCHFSAFGFYFI